MPQGWEWARIGFLFAHNTGKALNGAQRSGNLLPYITTSNLYWDRFELGSIRQMYFNDAEIEKCTVTKGDLLVCEGGDIGRAAIWMSDQHICIQNHIHRLRAYYPLCTRFFYYIFLLYKGIGNIGGKGIGIQGLSSGAIHNILVPVPSSQEQDRISIAIDHVLPLIEKYEKSQERLDSLNAEIPNRVKKAILQEAIQGHLVSQDATGEPAATLLQRIIDEKHRLLEEGKIKKKDIVESIIFKGEDNKYYEKSGDKAVDISEELPFDIPSSWAWCRLGSVIILQSGQDLDPERFFTIPKGLPYITGASNLAGGVILVNRWTNTPTSISHKGDLLITCKGTVGAMAYNTIGDIHIARQIMSIHSDWILIDYIEKYLEYSIPKLEKAAHSIIPGISREIILSSLIPIPPLDEQRRIIDRVREIQKNLLG